MADKTMTEKKWLKCTDPLAMLKFLQQRASERKLRLFACACHRQFRWLYSRKHEVAEGAITLAEQVADGKAEPGKLDEIALRLRNLQDEFFDLDCSFDAQIQIAMHVVLRDPFQAALHTADCVMCEALPEDADETEPLDEQPEYSEAEKAVVSIVREVFGNPFLPFTVDRAWLVSHDKAVLRLAQAAHKERALPEGTLEPDRLAVLADALEDAGCTDADILSHLRGPGPHYRGCFAIDLILGKK